MLASFPLFFSWTLFSGAPDLATVDAFVAADRFTEAFHAGERAVIETKSCISGFCDKAYETSFVVSSVTGDSAVTEGLGNDGQTISSATVSRGDWEANHQNRVRFELASLAGAGYRAEVTKIAPASLSLHLNGRLDTVATMTVEIHAVNGVGMKLAETLEVAPGLGGQAQLVRKSSDGGSLGTNVFTVTKVER